MSEDELLATATILPPPEPPRASGTTPDGSTSSGTADAKAPALPAAAGTNVRETKVATPPGDAWRRVSLLPGLELWLAEDASPAVRQIARQIQTYCTQRDEGAAGIESVGASAAH